MPLFDYKCEDCGHVEEFLISADDETDLACLRCGGRSHREFPAPVGKVEGGTRKFHPKRGKRREI